MDIPTITMRIIPNTLPKYEDLGLPEVIKSLTYLPQGVILVTGKTNSGKTTTLNSIIDEINQKLSYLPTLKDILAQLNTNYFDDANFTSEYGVAIYGSFNSVGITYLEVDRLFQLIQNKAYELGYPIGSEIPVNILYSEQKYGDTVSR